MANVTLKKVELPNGETIAYREREGGKKVFLLVHGNMSSSKHWDILIDVLDEKYKVYAIDLPGFGESTFNNKITSIRDFSESVRQFVEVLDLKVYALMGWSLGGTVCMQYCADYDDACEKLLLLCSGSTRGYPYFATLESGLPDLNNRLTKIDEIKKDSKWIMVQGAYDKKDKEFLKAMWNQVIYTDNQPNEEKYDEYLEEMCKQRNLSEVYQALNLFNISHHNNSVSNGTGEVDKINVPVLVMWGDKDLVVVEQMTKEILEDLGEKAIYKELPGCGHSPLTDDIDLVNKTVQEFLEGVHV